MSSHPVSPAFGLNFDGDAMIGGLLMPEESISLCIRALVSVGTCTARHTASARISMASSNCWWRTLGISDAVIFDSAMKTGSEER